MKSHVGSKSLLTLFGAGVISALGCGTNPEPTSVVCTDFRAGADMSKSTFGVTGELQRPYVAFAQAAGDLAAVANEMLRDVGAACQGLAIELGADPEDARTRGKLEPEAVRAWCRIAAEHFVTVKPKLDGSSFAVMVTTPKCTTDTDFQTTCEKRCTVQATCTEASVEQRCPVEGREGICSGVCSGICTGSESAAAECEGTCSGTCFGTCAAEGTGGASGSAMDDGADCSTGCACTTLCKGTCTAACTPAAGGAHCDAICSGGCSEPMRAQTCTQPLTPPTCKGDVDCQKSCEASGAARAVCPQGSLRVSIDPEARKRADVARVVGALERHLPAIFLAARGRAKVLEDGASDVLDTAGNILNRADQLGPMGAACGMLIGQTGDEAKTSLNAALAGSKDLAHAVTGERTTDAP